MTSMHGWGSIPRTHETVLRQTLLRRIERTPQPVIFVSAPAGFGKTTLAAQLSGRAGDEVWPEDSRSLAREILRTPESGLGHLSAALPDGVRGFLVLDDCSLPDGQSTELLPKLARLARLAQVRAIITTRQDTEIPSAISGLVAHYDHRDLFLSSDEARALICSDGSADEAILDQWLEEFGGHPELTALHVHSGEGATMGPRHSAAIEAAIDRYISSAVGPDSRRMLQVAALIQQGSVEDVDRLLGDGAGDSRLSELAGRLTLLRVTRQTRIRQLRFELHPTAADVILANASREGLLSTLPVFEAIEALADAGRWDRAAELLVSLCDVEERLRFVRTQGNRMLKDGGATVLLDIVNSVPLSKVMAEPAVFLHWAIALGDVGDAQQSASKAAAAAKLARHAGDYETTALAIMTTAQCLQDRGQLSDAIEQMDLLIKETFPRLKDSIRFDVLVAYGDKLGLAGRIDEAKQALAAAQELIGGGLHNEQARRLDEARAYAHAVWEGDYAEGTKALAALLPSDSSSTSSAQFLMGNVAWMLNEMGRRDRAKTLLAGLDLENPAIRAAYHPLFALFRASEGDLNGAVAELTAIDPTHSTDADRADDLIHLIYRSAVRRAAGLLEESLMDAESAFEGLIHIDLAGQARLAVVEVAASLAALGDLSAAERWLCSSDVDWNTVNRQHLLVRHFLRVVVAARRGVSDGVESLPSELAAHLLAGNANWRIAMHVAAFPELLGLIAAEIGADRIPSHLLRSVPTERLPEALSAARGMLSEADWRVLGERALGEEQFREYVERAGKPICRVRLFGGLEVNADGRPVTEKDWKKRKARMLFAMLALNNGQDLSRDVILEHLWPDLTEDKAKNNFYVVWSTMKSALTGPDQEGACPYIESRRGRCRVVKEFVHTDVDDIDSLFEQIRQADAEGRTDDALVALQELMSFYRGDLLPGDLYDDWFAAPRERYRFEFIDAMLKGAELLMERDDPYEALVFARRALMMDPYREDLYQAVLRCQILAGQRSAAIETFIQCKSQLAEELGLDPTAETQALYQQILAMEERPRYDTYGLTDN